MCPSSLEETFENGIITSLKKSIIDFSQLPESVRENPRIVLAAIQQRANAITIAAPKLLNDYDFIFKAVEANGLVLQHLSEAQKNHSMLALIAIQQNPNAIEFVSEELRNKQGFINGVFTPAFLLHQPNLFQFIGKGFLEREENREFILKAIKLNGLLLQYLSPEQQNDKDFALAAIQNNAEACKYVNQDLLGNAAFIRSVCETSNSAMLIQRLTKQPQSLITLLSEGIIDLSHQNLRGRHNEKALVLAALKFNASAILSASPELLNNPKFIIQALGANEKVAGFLSAAQKNDTKCIRAAVNQNPENIRYAGETILHNPDFMLSVALEHNIIQYLETDQINTITDQLLCHGTAMPDDDSKLMKSALSRINDYLVNDSLELEHITNHHLLAKFLIQTENKKLILEILTGTQPGTFPSGTIATLCSEHNEFKQNLAKILRNAEARELIMTQYPELSAVTFQPEKLVTTPTALASIFSSFDNKEKPPAKAALTTSVDSNINLNASRDFMKAAKKHIYDTKPFFISEGHKKQHEVIENATNELNKSLDSNNSGDIQRNFKQLCISVCEYPVPINFQPKWMNQLCKFFSNHFNFFHKFANEACTVPSTAEKSLETPAAKGLVKLLTEKPELRKAIGIKTEPNSNPDSIKAAVKEVIQGHITKNVENKSLPSP